MNAYQFTAIAVLWRDKRYGNTYHSVRIIDNITRADIACPMQYGYGEMFRETALIAMAKKGWLPAAYCEPRKWWNYERENNYPILWSVSNGTKKECIANGGE